jgi:hypothetical protein
MVEGDGDGGGDWGVVEGDRQVAGRRDGPNNVYTYE